MLAGGSGALLDRRITTGTRARRPPRSMTAPEDLAEAIEWASAVSRRKKAALHSRYELGRSAVIKGVSPLELALNGLPRDALSQQKAKTNARSHSPSGCSNARQYGGRFDAQRMTRAGDRPIGLVPIKAWLWSAGLVAVRDRTGAAPRRRIRHAQRR
jgi:hypothetical protein